MKSSFRHTMLLIALACVLLLSVALAFVYQDYQAYLHEPMLMPEPYTMNIETGSGFGNLKQQLVESGFIKDGRYLDWYVRHHKLAGSIKAGSYTFDKSPTPIAFMQRIVSGKVDQYQLTVVEGWSFRQMLSAIHMHEHIKPLLAELSNEQIMERLGRPSEHPEGLFFPDTYRFPSGITDIEFLKRAMKLMQKHLDSEWKNRDKTIPLKTPYEALILASIIEKETGAPHERAQIAGVFTRRLVKGMRLQTDPTVIYGMGDSFDGNIRRRDLKQDTAYNTYTRFGLPPTPIALPGLASIRAALNPADGKTLYFVGKGDGTHYFSTTLEEHNRAVAKYQLGR